MSNPNEMYRHDCFTCKDFYKPSCPDCTDHEDMKKGIFVFKKWKCIPQAKLKDIPTIIKAREKDFHKAKEIYLKNHPEVVIN